MPFDITNWSPNYLSVMPYHLQLKDVILRAIEDGRFSDVAILPKPNQIGVSSLFQKEYAVRAFDLLVHEGKLQWMQGRGYCLV